MLKSRDISTITALLDKLLNNLALHASLNKFKKKLKEKGVSFSEITTWENVALVLTVNVDREEVVKFFLEKLFSRISPAGIDLAEKMAKKGSTVREIIESAKHKCTFSESGVQNKTVNFYYTSWEYVFLLMAISKGDKKEIESELSIYFSIDQQGKLLSKESKQLLFEWAAIVEKFHEQAGLEKTTSIITNYFSDPKMKKESTGLTRRASVAENIFAHSVEVTEATKDRETRSTLERKEKEVFEKPHSRKKDKSITSVRRASVPTYTSECVQEKAAQKIEEQKREEQKEDAEIVGQALLSSVYLTQKFERLLKEFLSKADPQVCSLLLEWAINLKSDNLNIERHMDIDDSDYQIRKDFLLLELLKCAEFKDELTEKLKKYPDIEKRLNRCRLLSPSSSSSSSLNPSSSLNSSLSPSHSSSSSPSPNSSLNPSSSLNSSLSPSHSSSSSSSQTEERKRKKEPQAGIIQKVITRPSVIFTVFAMLLNLRAKVLLFTFLVTEVARRIRRSSAKRAYAQAQAGAEKYSKISDTPEYKLGQDAQRSNLTYVYSFFSISTYLPWRDEFFRFRAGCGSVITAEEEATAHSRPEI